MSSNDFPIQPTLREDRIYEMRNHLADWLKSYHPELVRTCLSCSSFNEPSEYCQRYKARPPARVIAYGCPSYINEDEIPF